LLSLYSRVTNKTLRISKTLGIEGGQLLTPDDDFQALKNFNEAYEHKTKTEELSLVYDRLLKGDPLLKEKLEALPGRVFSGKSHPSPGTRAVFFCFALPARVASGGPPVAEAPLFEEHATETEWSLEAGPVRWYLYDLAGKEIAEEVPRIAEIIKCDPDTPRHCVIGPPALSEVRAEIEKHIKNTYLRQVQAPVNAPKPALRCWMELS
jgi:hypothetical protein